MFCNKLFLSLYFNFPCPSESSSIISGVNVFLKHHRKSNPFNHAAHDAHARQDISRSKRCGSVRPSHSHAGIKSRMTLTRVKKTP